MIEIQEAVAAQPRPRIPFASGSLLSFEPQFWNFLVASLFFDVGMFIFSFLYNLYLLDRGLTERTMGWIAGALALGSIGTLMFGPSTYASPQ